ncbi:hypothetical protein [Novosphingobium lindaniclasticum]
MTEKLMPCPFCGGAAVRKADPGVVNVPFGLVVDHVPGCFLAMPFPTDDEAVDLAWNTRHPTPAADEVVEMFGLCRALLQEAKGGGGDKAFVTAHLDDADNWLDRVESAYNTRYQAHAIAAMQARSAEPRYKPNRGERPETLRDDGKCGSVVGRAGSRSRHTLTPPTPVTRLVRWDAPPNLRARSRWRGSTT